MPTSRSSCSSASSELYVVVLGGLSEDEDALDTVEVLDTDRLAWYSVARLPRPVAFAACALSADAVYVVGGECVWGGKIKALLDSRDPGPAWTEVTVVPGMDSSFNALSTVRAFDIQNHSLVSDLGSLVVAMGAMRVVVAAAKVAAGEVVVGALVPILVPVVGLVQVAVLLLLLLAAAGAMLLLLLVAVGAALLLLAADCRGAALHLTESIETKCKDLVVIFFVLSKQSALLAGTVALEVASKHCTLVVFAHYTSAGFVVIH
eukprot:Em0024g57a